MHVQRRTVLQAGGLIAVGGLVVACGGGGDAAPATTTPAEPSAAPDVATEGAGQSEAPTAGTALPEGALAQVNDVPVGSGLIIADPAVVITQPTEGEVHCFSAICPHQGCLVGSVEDNQIVCPCHMSVFSATDGSVLQGPATSPLPTEDITVVDGVVVLA